MSAKEEWEVTGSKAVVVEVAVKAVIGNDFDVVVEMGVIQLDQTHECHQMNVAVGDVGEVHILLPARLVRDCVNTRHQYVEEHVVSLLHPF